MNKIATLLSFLRRSEMENLIFKNCNHKTFYIVQFHINLRFVWLQLDSNPQSLTAPKLAKWLSCVVSTYLHSAFDCMFLSCWVRVSNKDFQAFRFSDFHVGVSDIQATIECWFTLKRVRDVIRAYSQMHRRDKYSRHSPIIWPAWPNGWLFVYELGGCGFGSSWSHLNSRFRVCFEQGVPWHSGNYRVWIRSETRTWHDRNIQSVTLYAQQKTILKRSV